VTISEGAAFGAERMCDRRPRREVLPRRTLKKKVGDLVDYMSAAIEKAVNADVDRAVMKDRS